MVLVAQNSESPDCTVCGASMMPFRVLPELQGRPKLEIFECQFCRKFETRAPDLQRAYQNSQSLIN